MGAVRMLAGLEVRQRWRRVVFLAVLVGFVGAVVLSSVAGARRTSSALSRFNASSRAAALELFVGNATPGQLREFGHVKNVVSFAPLRGGALLFPKAPGLQAIAQAMDTRFGTVVDRPRVIAGRLARSTAVDEANIGEALAAQLHIAVGDHLDGESYTPAQVDQCLTGGCSQATIPAGPRIRLRIVGIVRRPLDLGDRGAVGGVLVLTPAFNQKYENRIGSFSGTILRVRARNGAADVGQIAAAARRIFGQSPQFGAQDLAVDTQGAQNAIDVLVVALWTFAGVAALAGARRDHDRDDPRDLAFRDRSDDAAGAGSHAAPEHRGRWFPSAANCVGWSADRAGQCSIRVAVVPDWRRSPGRARPRRAPRLDCVRARSRRGGGRSLAPRVRCSIPHDASTEPR